MSKLIKIQSIQPVRLDTLVWPRRNKKLKKVSLQKQPAVHFNVLKVVQHRIRLCWVNQISLWHSVEHVACIVIFDENEVSFSHIHVRNGYKISSYSLHHLCRNSTINNLHKFLHLNKWEFLVVHTIFPSEHTNNSQNTL